MATVVAQDVPLKTVEDRVAEYGDAVRERLEPHFRAAGLPYPPERVTLVGLKRERIVQVYAGGAEGESPFVCAYPILAASGTLGPKLREGDRQVPEGIYPIRELNPNSLYHLSLWIGYPNEFDLVHAAEEGRTEPGGEIMIHGGAESRGCLAVGDPAAEDLFVLAALAGIDKVTVILAPFDFRDEQGGTLPNELPPWSAELYARIKAELAKLPPAVTASPRDELTSRAAHRESGDGENATAAAHTTENLSARRWASALSVAPPVCRDRARDARDRCGGTGLYRARFPETTPRRGRSLG